MKTRKNSKSQRVLPLIIMPFIFMIILQSCKKPAGPEKNNLTVQAVIGDVTVTVDGADKSPQAGDKILENSVIKTGQSSLIDVNYADYGVIRINENSIMLVSDLKQDSMVELKKGKIFAVLSKLKKNTQFRVKTTTTVAAIRGTSFRISADEKKSRIDVLAGTVKVNPVKEGKVVEDVEKFVEKDTAVEMNEKTVDEIIEKKQEIEVSAIKPETVEEIKMEAKNIALNEKTSEAVKEEMKAVGIESIIVKTEPTNPVEDGKTGIEEEKKTEPETEKEPDKKIDEERDRLKKEKKQAKKKKREARLKKQAEQEIAREEKKQAENELKERREREKIAGEKKEKEARETEQREQRVKNIPTL